MVWSDLLAQSFEIRTDFGDRPLAEIVPTPNRLSRRTPHIFSVSIMVQSKLIDDQAMLEAGSIEPPTGKDSFAGYEMIDLSVPINLLG